MPTAASGILGTSPHERPRSSAVWRDGDLLDRDGRPLVRDTEYTYTDGRDRFPVVDEIPFLRDGREQLRDEVVRALDRGDEREGLILLLADQDDWAVIPPPTAHDLQPLFKVDVRLTEAMRYLQYGPVADYFAYRWSDPTFLSGLGLLDWHLPATAANVVEIGCGIGHYLREMILRGIRPTGVDVVFSKLWLARKFVAPTARLVCCDVNRGLPFEDEGFDAAFCHDAFYFLTEKRFIASELSRVTDGPILIGHAHNADADNFSAGAAVTVADYAEMFRGGDTPLLYDDDDLKTATLTDRCPSARSVEDLHDAAAVAIVAGAESNNRPNNRFAMPAVDAVLRVNPLFGNGENTSVRRIPRFPSKRYEEEYGALSGYLQLDEQLSADDQAAAAGGSWAGVERMRDLVRRRIFLDLPEKW